MIVNLHNLLIELCTDDERARAQWLNLFDYETATASPEPSGRAAYIIIKVRVLAGAGPIPPGKPLYTSRYPPLQVFVQDDDLILVPSDQARINLNLRSDAQRDGQQMAQVLVAVAPEILENGGFEDVITLALAPFLRRKGFFMVHAFTASWGRKAVMFAGPRGQGKTTAGLALVCNGWHLLANDVALLSDNGLVQALLSPGTVHVSPATAALLPQLAGYREQFAPHHIQGKIPIPRLALLNKDKPQTAAELKAVYFPEIEPGSRHKIAPMPRAVGMARLMESSIDQWDRGAWQRHVDFLERLSHQVTFSKLILGQDVNILPALIEEDLQQKLAKETQLTVDDCL